MGDPSRPVRMTGRLGVPGPKRHAAIVICTPIAAERSPAGIARLRLRGPFVNSADQGESTHRSARSSTPIDAAALPRPTDNTDPHHLLHANAVRGGTLGWVPTT